MTTRPKRTPPHLGQLAWDIAVAIGGAILVVRLATGTADRTTEVVSAVVLATHVLASLLGDIQEWLNKKAVAQ